MIEFKSKPYLYIYLEKNFFDKKKLIGNLKMWSIVGLASISIIAIILGRIIW